MHACVCTCVIVVAFIQQSIMQSQGKTLNTSCTLHLGIRVTKGKTQQSNTGRNNVLLEEKRKDKIIFSNAHRSPEANTEQFAYLHPLMWQ